MSLKGWGMISLSRRSYETMGVILVLVRSQDEQKSLKMEGVNLIIKSIKNFSKTSKSKIISFVDKYSLGKTI